VASQIPESGKDPCSAELLICTCLYLNPSRERDNQKSGRPENRERARDWDSTTFCHGIGCKKWRASSSSSRWLLPPSPVPCPHAADTTLPEISGYRTFLTWGWEDSVLPD
jgi:hypothetical protein